MKSKIKLTGDVIVDLQILQNECSNNNQICYHIKNSKLIINYLETVTGLKDQPIAILYFHYKEDIKEIPKCICGKNRKYHCNGYRPTCTNMKCINIVREESKKKFCMEKYGVEYTFQLNSVKEKSKITLLEKYGVDNSTKSPEIIQKRKENNLKKYGVTDTLMLKSFRGNTSKRGIDLIQSGLPEGYKVMQSDRFYYYVLKCPKNHLFEIGKSVLYIRKRDGIEICNQCNEYIGSKGEQEVYDYIRSLYSGNINRSNRTIISPFEIDMVIPELNLCIEFNGDYWHSDKVNDNKYYHLNKLNLCLMKGYDLLQIKENDWNTNKEEIKRKLFNIINHIYDINDLNIKNGELIFDLSWYDSKIIEGLDNLLKNNIDPFIEKVGQHNQWNCGYKIYDIK